jgi:two-component sensor histidine kinase
MMCMMMTGPSPSPAGKMPGAFVPSAADEANHRIANQLQLIAALILVEARGASPETSAALERTRERIVAVGAIHRHLYAHDDAEIDLGAYLDELGERLSRSCGPERPIVIDADSVPVTGDVATMIGLLTTELVTNACKHAYRTGEPGGVRVSLRRQAQGGHWFMVEDRGQASGSATSGTGLGSRLIDAMVLKLGAVASWDDAQPGTRFRMDARF